MRRLALGDRKRVLEALDFLVSDPLSGDVKKLKGRQEQWRLRVGSLRILFVPDMKRKTILVRNVGDRSSIYRE